MKTEISLRAAIFLRAAELVEQGHCKGSYAQDKNGMQTRAKDARAVSWCAQGAVDKAAHEFDAYDIDPRMSRAERWWRILDRAPGVGSHVPAWNDANERTAAEVAATLREVAFT